jgi:GTP-binding protein HflX
VEKVLAELEAQDKPAIRVLNKVDLLLPKERESLPGGDNIVQVSAMEGDGLENLLERIDAILTADPVSRVQVSIPQSEGKLLAMAEARGTILNREYNKDRVELTVEGPESLLRKLERFRVSLPNQFTTETRRTRRKHLKAE